MRMTCALLLTAWVASSAVAQTPASFADAASSDPVAMGWMVGAPPPSQRLIRFDDGSFLKFPQLRWSFSHWRELYPTVEVARGDGPVSPLPRSERTDLDAVTFVPLGGTQPMTWEQSLSANYTDGILVMHRGRVVYERYFGGAQARGNAYRAFGHQVLCRHDRRDAGGGRKARPGSASVAVPPGTGAQWLRRCDGAAGARHDHRHQVQREVR